MLAYENAKRHKTANPKIKEFSARWAYNLAMLKHELRSKTYTPRPLKKFVLRDPKTRIISVSDFRDRVVHHALINILQPIFEPRFIYDSYASRKGKGVLSAIKRFEQFQRRITKNGTRITAQGSQSICKEREHSIICGYVLKADIYHYFESVDRKILLDIISRRVNDTDVLWLIKQILYNHDNNNSGMPLGNWTSQFFANIYLNDLDQYVKHTLKARYYIRYVDDFVVLDTSKTRLQRQEAQIQIFLATLKLRLHPNKCRITPLHRGTTFLGFRIFSHHRLVRQRNIRKMRVKLNMLLDDYERGEVDADTIMQSLQGWDAYAKHANTHHLREHLSKEVIDQLERRTAIRKITRNAAQEISLNTQIDI